MKFISRNSYWALLFFILCETLFLFYINQVGMPHTLNAVCYFGSSVMFGIVLLMRYYGKDIEEAAPSAIPMTKAVIILASSVLLLGFCIYRTNHLVSTVVSAEHSDIITTVEIVSKRFLNHIPVYTTPIFATDHELPVTYLPMHWLPYTISTFFQFDARWIAFAIFLLAVLWLSVRNYKYEASVPLLCIGLLSYMLYRNSSMVADTIEIMVAGYYILFIISMNKKNVLMQGLMVGVCLLSRYSLLLWLPLFGYALFIADKRKELFKTMLVAACFVVLVYVIPFLSADWSSFGKGYKYYSVAALGEWSKGDVPFQLHRGVGVAYFFFCYLKGSLEEKLHVVQKVHLFASIGITIALGIWYRLNKDRVNYKIFLLASFKIYLAVFLVFIQVPYEYLMIVANFVSIAIFAEQSRYRIKSV